MRADTAHRAAIRRWRPGFPCAVDAIWGPLRKGPGDPAYARDGDQSTWRAVRTPRGPATLHVVPRPAVAEIHARAWGEGAAWVLEHLPAMLGAEDDPAAFQPDHPWLRRMHARYAGLRVPKGRLVFEAALAAAIEQKVTGQEAFRGWRQLLRRYGDPAPGPGAERGMRVPPGPATVARIPSWEWLRMPVDPARSRAAIALARVAPALERTVGLDAAEVDRRLRSVTGVGRWTAAEVRQRAHGDADAISLGDYHVSGCVGWALVGEKLDDDAVEELLEPYRPHRFRVQRLVEIAGAGPPRRGPRMAPRRHLPG